LNGAFQTARNAALTGVARFKWSRDNASFAVQVVAVSSDRRTLTLASLGRDQATALRQGDLVEFCDDASELGPARGHLTNLVADPDPDQLTVVLADPLPGAQGGSTGSPPSSPPPSADRHPVLRRWDGTGTAQAAFVAGQTLDMDLGEGVQIQFGGADLLPGDYWQFAARSADGTVEALTNALPSGIVRHRCPLAVVRWSTRPLGSPPGSPPTGYTLAVIADCRQVFPSLVDAPRTQAGLHVEQVSAGDLASGTASAVFNDTSVLVPQLIGGLNILCDGPVDPASLTRTTCIVSVEIPYIMELSTSPPLALAGYQPLVLGGNATVSGSLITWKPTADAATSLPSIVALKPDSDLGLLTRLTLKGNFIWSQDRQLFLDGEAFALGQSGVMTLNLPSGDRRRGGDFEMWFWLNLQPAALASMTLAAQAFVGDTLTGTLTLTGPAPIATVITPTSSASNIVAVSSPAQFAFGATQATFALKVVAAGSVSIAASFGGASFSSLLATNNRPVTLVGLSLPTSILKGDTVAGTVILSGPAPAGSTLTITSSTTGTIHPAPGATTASFNVFGNGAGVAQIVVALSNSNTLSQSLTVRQKPVKEGKEASKDNKDRKDGKDDAGKDGKDGPHDKLVTERLAAPLPGNSGAGLVNGVAGEPGGNVAHGRAFIRPEERPQLARPLRPRPDA
jgi:hypothetical protein